MAVDVNTTVGELGILYALMDTNKTHAIGQSVFSNTRIFILIILILLIKCIRNNNHYDGKILYVIIVSECSKLVLKEYKNRHDWVWLIIHRELCKRMEFDHTYKRHHKLCCNHWDGKFALSTLIILHVLLLLSKLAALYFKGPFRFDCDKS